MSNSIHQDMSKEPLFTLKATKSQIQILDSKYKKADLGAIVEDKCNHPSASLWASLLEHLQDFEELSDRTLGDWDFEPVSLQLKEEAQS